VFDRRQQGLRKIEPPAGPPVLQKISFFPRKLLWTSIAGIFPEPASINRISYDHQKDSGASQSMGAEACALAMLRTIIVEM
jgi:hypothetical protein